jgi:hypothetical protein
LDRMKVIDTSEWNPIDWGKVHLLREAGIEGVINRASIGYRIDPTFKEKHANFKAHGFFRGAYHFLYPQYDLNTQIATFLGQLTDPSGKVDWAELGEYDDAEYSGGILPASRIPIIHRDFGTRYHDRTGRLLGLYSAAWFWIWDTPWVNEIVQWGAQWPYDNQTNIKDIVDGIWQNAAEGKLNPTAMPRGWNPMWWQLSSKGDNPAVMSSNLDYDVSIPTREEVLDYFQISDQPQPPTTLEELIDRYLKLERWAQTQGYPLEGD